MNLKIVQKSKYNKTKLRYLQLNVSLSFLAGLGGILLSFAIVGKEELKAGYKANGPSPRAFT